YPSVRVLLGAARGANWWCVLYPIMCTVEPILEPGVEGAGEPDPAASDPAVAAALYRQPALDEALLWPEAARPPIVPGEIALQPAPVEIRLAFLDWARRWPPLRQAVERLEAVLTHASPTP
ncbi:MAG TPA: stage II sporulation protein R, partial [Bacillota bacterium]